MEFRKLNVKNRSVCMIYGKLYVHNIEVSPVCREDYVIFQIRHHQRIKISKQSELYIRPTETTWQASMVTSFGVIVCNNNQNNCSYGFFSLPNIRKTTPEKENLSLGRRRKWLANIKRSDLSNAQLATENSTFKSIGLVRPKLKLYQIYFILTSFESP